MQEVVELDLVDRRRPTKPIGTYPGSPQRDLPTTVYLPPTADPAPLIVLAHGFDGHPRKFSRLAGVWAAAGYVVAVPAFPVSNDRFAVRQPEFLVDRVSDVAEQGVDVRFIIDEVLAANADPRSELNGRVDPDHVGLFGLSLGSHTVWTTLLGDGATETRVTALIQSDGSFPGDHAQLAEVTFPVFVAHSDCDPIFGADVLLDQFATLPGPKFMLVLHGAAHASVAENTTTAADDAYATATTVFWDRYLQGRTDRAFPPEIAIPGVTTFTDGS